MLKSVLRVIGRLFRGPSPILYRYRCGRRTRYAEPVAVASRLEDVYGKEWADGFRTLRPLGKFLSETLGPSEIAARETRRKETFGLLARMARDVFNLPPFNEDTGDGCSDPQAVEVLAGFAVFCADLAESARPF